MFQKTDHAGYEKDVSSNLVINNNKDEYLIHVQNREKSKQFNQMAKEIEALKKRVSDLESQIQLMLKFQGING